MQLKDKVLVTGVSVEHIPKSLAPNGTVDSAPRDFSVYVSILLFLTWCFLSTTNNFICIADIGVYIFISAMCIFVMTFEWSSQGLSSVEDKGTSLGRFSYDSDRTPIQQFEVEVCKLTELVITVLFV